MIKNLIGKTLEEAKEYVNAFYDMCEENPYSEDNRFSPFFPSPGSGPDNALQYSLPASPPHVPAGSPADQDCTPVPASDAR